MNPVAFSIFGLDIRWYGIIIAIGLMLGLIICQYTCKFRDIKSDTIFDIILIALPFSIIGARMYYVIFEFERYKDDLWSMFNIRQGGLAFHGGLIAAVIVVILYTKYKKVNFLKVADVVAPSIILAQALGRWGNFFNQEAHGGTVSYEFISKFPKFIQNGMHIDGNYYHPTFLYESIWNLISFIILINLLRKSKKTGIVFFAYIALYSVGRFIIEGLRTDSLMLGNFRIAQIISLTGIIAFIIFMIVTRSKNINSK